MSGLFRNVLCRCLQKGRTFSRNTVRYEKAPSTSNAKAEPQSNILSNKTKRVSDLEKRMLVWSGKFKTVEEIPAYLAPEVVDRAKNKARIRLANIMMLLTIIACIGMVISGKNAAERGETVQKMNLDWHKRIKEEEEAKALKK